MRRLYIDPFAGASGDMMLAALIDTAPDGPALCRVLERRLREALPFELALRVEREVRSGMAGARVHVKVEEPHASHRGLADCLAIILGSSLPERVKQGAGATFTLLAEAEAEVHGTTVEKVHFHEVGAGDALVDIIGTHLLLAELDVDEVRFGAAPLGSGTVRCAHGELPVPAPATALLMRGLPVSDVRVEGEAVTPTGAALLASIGRPGLGPGGMVFERVGCGFGSRQGEGLPNGLRAFLGRGEGDPDLEEVAVLETTVDDSTGEVLGHLFDRLAEAGALEVATTAVGMKKSRPGVRVTVVAPVERERDLAETLLRETSSFGVRIRRDGRLALERETVSVETPWGPVRVKVGRLGAEAVQASPEFEDCREAAARGGVALREVFAAAQGAFQRERRE